MVWAPCLILPVLLIYYAIAWLLKKLFNIDLQKKFGGQEESYEFSIFILLLI